MGKLIHFLKLLNLNKFFSSNVFGLGFSLEIIKYLLNWIIVFLKNSVGGLGVDVVVAVQGVFYKFFTDYWKYDPLEALQLNNE